MFGQQITSFTALKEALRDGAHVVIYVTLYSGKVTQSDIVFRDCNFYAKDFEGILQDPTIRVKHFMNPNIKIIAYV